MHIVHGAQRLCQLDTNWRSTISWLTKWPSTVMLCSTIGIPDHYDKGATVETRQLCLFLGDQAPAQTSDGP